MPESVSHKQGNSGCAAACLLATYCSSSLSSSMAKVVAIRVRAGSAICWAKFDVSVRIFGVTIMADIGGAPWQGGAFQWVQGPPGEIAPAGSNRSRHGGDEM